jgi:hypothetical protein
VVDVIRDDPGHQRLVAGVPAELLGVHRPVPLNHPAHVARLRRPQHVPTRRRGLRQHVGNDVHGVDQPVPVLVTHHGQQVPGLRGGPAVQPGHHRTPAVRQPDDLPTPVRGRALPADEPVGLEPGQDAAQVARVDVDRMPQIRDLARVTLRELEQDPGLGERVRRVQVLAAQQPDRVRVEPVERPHPRHRRVPRDHRPRCLRSHQATRRPSHSNRCLSQIYTCLQQRYEAEAAEGPGTAANRLGSRPVGAAEGGSGCGCGRSAVPGSR